VGPKHDGDALDANDANDDDDVDDDDGCFQSLAEEEEEGEEEEELTDWLRSTGEPWHGSCADNLRMVCKGKNLVLSVDVDARDPLRLLKLSLAASDSICPGMNSRELSTSPEPNAASEGSPGDVTPPCDVISMTSSTQEELWGDTSASLYKCWLASSCKSPAAARQAARSSSSSSSMTSSLPGCGCCCCCCV